MVSLLAASHDDSAHVGSLMWDLRDKSAKKSRWLVGREIDVTKRILVTRVTMEICHVHGQELILWAFIPHSSAR
jgi:hypothetical protein